MGDELDLCGTVLDIRAFFLNAHGFERTSEFLDEREPTRVLFVHELEQTGIFKLFQLFELMLGQEVFEGLLEVEKFTVTSLILIVRHTIQLRQELSSCNNEFLRAITSFRHNWTGTESQLPHLGELVELID